MNKRISIPILIALLVLLLNACTHHYTPNPDRFRTDPIVDFKPSDKINIVNAQPSSGDYLYAAAGVHKHYGNLHEWTDAAIVIATKELDKRGMSTISKADKSLNMSITKAQAIFGMWVVRGEITMMVETGDGYQNTYFADNRSPGGIHRAIDGAVMRAVVAMLNDEKITRYLAK